MVTAAMGQVIQIDGGQGRVLCAEPALRHLAQTTPVTVLTNWPEVFLHHPTIQKVYRLGHEYLFEDVIRHGIFRFPEPYFCHLYYTQKHHLIQSFNYLLNDKDDFDRPQIFFSVPEKRLAEKRISELKTNLGSRPIVALQAFGSSATFEGKDVYDPSFRSLSMETALRLVDAFKDIIFINCSHIPIPRDHVANPQFSSRELAATLMHTAGVVTIDSWLAHVAYSMSKKTIQILGSTFRENVSYDDFVIFQRPSYPRSYQPNRLHGFVEKNQEAMSFSEDELQEIIEAVRSRVLG